MARLNEVRKQLQSEDEAVRARAQEFLINNPNVNALVKKSGYRVVIIPISGIKTMGFSAEHFEEPDATGHLNILGSVDQFISHQYDFVELIKIGQARILTVEECLAQSPPSRTEEMQSGI